MNQAIRLSEAENGPMASCDYMENGYETDENGEIDYTKAHTLVFYNKYLAPYLQTAKVEISQTSTNGVTHIYFSDGSFVFLSRYSMFYVPVGGDWKDIQANNYWKDSGTKGFTFYLYQSPRKYCGTGVEPYVGGWDGTRGMLLNDNEHGCKETASGERAYCTKLIQMNNWKIPDDYPLKF